KTGMSVVPSPRGKLCEVPALRGLTPPTTVVPPASMRVVCLVPSEPVMPCTMTLESALMKMAMGVISLVRSGSGGSVGELGGLVGAAVHRLGEGHERVVGLGEDATTLLDVVAVEAHNERLVGCVAERREGLNDAVGDLVARRDAAEDVHEHGLDLLVTEDDVEARGHDCGRGAAADVEEVRWLDPTVRLAGVGDDVERAHDEPCAVADDAHRTIELDVVEVVLLGLRLERVRRGGVLELGVLRVTERGVVVEGDLAVEGDDLTVLGQHERVDLDERRVLALVDVPELDERRSDVASDLGREARGGDDLLGLRLVDAREGVDVDLRERLGALDRELLDLHATLDARHREQRAVGAVEQEGEVELLGDLGALGDHQGLDDVALDVEAEDLLGTCRGLLGTVRELDAAGLAAAARLDL